MVERDRHGLGTPSALVPYEGTRFEVRARVASSPGLVERETVEVFDEKTHASVGFAIVSGMRIVAVGRRSSHLSEADVRAIVDAFLRRRSPLRASSVRPRVAPRHDVVPEVLRLLADVLQGGRPIDAPQRVVEAIVHELVLVVDDETAKRLREVLATITGDEAEP